MTNAPALHNFSHTIVLFSSWRANSLCLLLGAVSGLALPPLHFFPILWVSFPILVLLLDGAVSDQNKGGIARLLPAFWRGYWFGFSYFVAGLWWIGSAFLVNAEKFALLMPLAVVGLPLVLALFFGCATAMARAFWHEGAMRVVALAFGFALFEFLRGTLFTGFPWNTIGSLLATNLSLMQGVSLFGLHNYTLFAVLIFASPVLLLDRQADQSQRIFLPLIVFLSLLIGLYAFGAWRLSGTEKTYVDGVSLRLIQPNIAQEDKFKPGKAREILDRYIELSARSTEPGDLGLLSTTHLIWPESAFPFLLTEQPQALAAIANLLPTGTTLLTGAVRADPRKPSEDSRRFYNSFYIIGHDGSIKDAYDKVHLVPFGEYLPFEKTLESLGLLSLVEVPGGFTAGTQKRTLRAGNAPAFLPLICYEIIFPGRITDDENQSKPHWILNVTNDAWFGITSGPYQHFHLTRLRAVDEGLPVIRVANNGITAVINSYGEVEKKIPLDQSGILQSKLPEKTSLKIGNNEKNSVFLFLMVLIFFLLGKKMITRR